MWAIILAATLSQTPARGREVAVIPVIHADVVTSELASRLEQLVRTALTEVEVPVTKQPKLEGQDPAACEANRACFALIGRALSAFAVVRVEGAVVGKEVAVLVQALESTTGQLIGETSFVVSIADLDREVPVRVAPLVKKLSAMLPTRKLVVVLEPSSRLIPEERAPGVEVTAPRAVGARSLAPVWITGTGAVVFAGAAAGLFAMGVSARSCLNGPPVNGVPTVCVAQSEAASTAQRADIGATTGTIAAGIAVGLAATTIVEWVILKD